METQKQFTDNAGITLDWDEIKDIATKNIQKGTTHKGLAEFYMFRLRNEEIIMWAQNSKGNFPLAGE